MTTEGAIATNLIYILPLYLVAFAEARIFFVTSLLTIRNGIVKFSYIS